MSAAHAAAQAYCLSTGIDRHAACQRNGHVSLNVEAEHCLPVEQTGRRLTAEWAGLIK
jgi:hypothetical protein